VHPAMRLWIGDALDRWPRRIAVGDVAIEGST
jgi:hypothetical protein